MEEQVCKSKLPTTGSMFPQFLLMFRYKAAFPLMSTKQQSFSWIFYELPVQLLFFSDEAMPRFFYHVVLFTRGVILSDIIA